MKSSVSQEDITMLYNAVAAVSKEENVHVIHAVPMVNLLAVLTYADAVCKAILTKHGIMCESRRTEYMQTPKRMLDSFNDELARLGIAA